MMKKQSKQLLASLCCIVTLVVSAAAAVEVGLLVEHIELPEKDATRLLLKGGSPVELRAEIDRHIADGNAKVVDVAYLVRPVLDAFQLAEIAKFNLENENFARSQSLRGNAQSILEYMYPTEWDPADVPSNIEVDVSADMGLKVPPHPTAFDVRDIGNQLDFSARYGTGDELLLAISTSTTYLSDLRKYGSGEDEVEQPQFGTKAIKTQAAAKHLEAIFIGMHTPRSAAQRDLRVFVFATPFVKQQPDEEKHAPILDLDERTITIGVEFIEVRQADLAELLSEKSSAELLIKNGKAKLSASGVLKTTPNQRAKVYPVHEFIYPTEYDAPEIVQNLTHEVLESGKPLKKAAVPTAFDVRNLGLSVEAQPELINTADGGQLIRVDLEAELVDLAKRLYWGKDEAKAEMPLIRLLSCNTELSIEPGKTTLAAILTPRDIENGKPDGQMRILVNVWADVTGN